MRTVFMRDEIVTGVNDACAPDYKPKRRSTADAAAKFRAEVKAAQINAKLDEVISLLQRPAAKDAVIPWGV